jgi:hypothetical protein
MRATDPESKPGSPTLPISLTHPAFAESPDLNSPDPPVQPTLCVNLAFSLALQRHAQILSPAEKLDFIDNCSITPEQLIAKIKSHDDIHHRTSHSRRCASRVEGFFTAVDRYLLPVSIMAGHHPDISMLVVGGLKLIVQVGVCVLH